MARQRFKQLLQFLNVEPFEFNLYSLRRGGATSYFFGSGSMDKTITIGRWESASTARIYIQQAAAQAAEMRLSSAQSNMLKRAAATLQAVLP